MPPNHVFEGSNLLRTLTLATAILLLAAVGVVHAGYQVGEAPESFRLPDADNVMWDLDQVVNRPCLVVFANPSWPMLTSYLAGLEREFTPYRSQGLNVIAVLTGRGATADFARRLRTDSGANFPIVLDTGGEVALRYQVSAYPLNVVISGRMIRERRVTSSYSESIRSLTAWRAASVLNATWWQIKELFRRK